jgi:hypothetical protein
MHGHMTLNDIQKIHAHILSAPLLTVNNNLGAARKHCEAQGRSCAMRIADDGAVNRSLYPHEGRRDNATVILAEHSSATSDVVSTAGVELQRRLQLMPPIKLFRRN